MKQLFVRGFQFAALITCLAVSVAILTFVTGCNDSAVTEIEVDNQQSYEYAGSIPEGNRQSPNKFIYSCIKRHS